MNHTHEWVFSFTGKIYGEDYGHYQCACGETETRKETIKVQPKAIYRKGYGI